MRTKSISEVTDILLSEVSPYMEEIVAYAFAEIEENAVSFEDAQNKKKSWLKKAAVGLAGTGVLAVGGGALLHSKGAGNFLKKMEINQAAGAINAKKTGTTAADIIHKVRGVRTGLKKVTSDIGKKIGQWTGATAKGLEAEKKNYKSQKAIGDAFDKHKSSLAGGQYAADVKPLGRDRKPLNAARFIQKQ